MPFALGKKPARKDAIKFKFAAYFDVPKLPTPPAVFGHYQSVDEDWGVFGNDLYGDCVHLTDSPDTLRYVHRERLLAALAKVDAATSRVLDDATADFDLERAS